MDSLEISDNQGVKRLKAVFKFKDGSSKTVSFGMKNSKGTFADGASEEKRDAYIARHKKNENWNDITTAGALSRWILWEHRENSKIEKLIKNKFNIKNVKVEFKRY
jgi:hypothetical protein